MRYAVILAGGTGTRFWPFSRQLEPKQLLSVVEKFSLLQSTLCRLKGVVPAKNIYIITNRAYFYEVKAQTEKFGVSEKNIILEPSGKNTAPAIGLCARLISSFDPQAVLVVLPSDHYVRDLPKFRSCLLKAIACAKEGFLVTIGIKPKTPSTGYGYIKVKSGSGGKGEGRQVERFLEKPALNKARQYFKQKGFFWNSGIFIWKAEVYLEQVKEFLPDLSRQLELIKGKEDILKVWPKVKPISVDYGIMERSQKIKLIPADFYWTDLGSWDALNEVLPKDKSGNVINADCLNFDCSNVSVFSRASRLISAVGLRDLIIADTPDALLVCHKDKTQEVGKIVRYLLNQQRKECVVHATEKRPWGKFTVLQSAQGFKIKLLEIFPKKRLSLQRHAKRAEHWVVVSGCAKVTSGAKTRLVPCNKSFFVAKGIKHRLENPFGSILRIVEVQTGNYLEEDDIERFSDDFAR